jgi:hypothetical protein
MGFKKKFFNILIGIVFLIPMFFYFFTPNPVLTTNGNVPIYDDINGAASGQGKIIFIAKGGNKFEIQACHDMKSFFILELKLNGNNIGFVRRGEYKFDRIPTCS